MEDFNKRPLFYNPEISPLVRKWMPDASETELIEATENLRRYLGVVYRIYCRLKEEGKLLRSGGDGDVGTKK